jgi:hypothetical protein
MGTAHAVSPPRDRARPEEKQSVVAPVIPFQAS